jgi:hypothetical protein
MLAGLMNVSDSMFNLSPKPEQPRTDIDAVRLNSRLKLVQVHADTFDLTDSEATRRYTDLCARLMRDTLSGDAVVNYASRHFVPDIRGYIAFIEWAEYRTETKPVMAGSTAAGGKKRNVKR